MGLLPDGATFEEQVTDYFVAVRGSGLMLSALDAELLSAWAQVGVPFDVVARGIRRAAERASHDARPGRPALTSLRACRRDVEVEIRKHLDRSAGATQERLSDPTARRPLTEERLAKMAQALRKLAERDGALQPVCARLAAALKAARVDTLEAVAVVEERVLVGLLRGLPVARRLQILREAKASAGTAHALSPRARKLALRVHRAGALRRALDLPPFW